MAKKSGFARGLIFLLVFLALAGILLGLIVHFNNTSKAYQATYQALLDTTPRPSPVPPNLDYRQTATLLRHGSVGPEVIQMQNRLKELGYYPGEVDGKFFDQSTTAVKAFQEQNGLDADGIAGEITLQLLYSDQAKPFVAPSTSPDSTNSSPAPGGVYTTPSTSPGR